MGLGKLLSCIWKDTSGDPSLIISRFASVKLHNKKSLVGSHLFEDVADDASVSVYFKVEEGALAALGISEVHFAMSVLAGGTCRTFFYDSPVISNDGTGINFWNKSRSVGAVNMLDSSIHHTPTITDSGDLIVPGIIPGGSGIASIGGVGEDLQWVSDGSRTSLLTITNKSGNAIDIAVTVDLYV